MSYIASDKLDRNDLYVIIAGLFSELRKAFNFANLKWLVVYALTIHLSGFGFSDFLWGRVFKGFLYLFSPFVLIWLYFNVHSSGMILSLLHWGLFIVILWKWGKNTVVHLFMVCAGYEVTVVPEEGDEWHYENEEGAPVWHAFWGDHMLALIALTLLYYQFIYINWSDLPFIPYLVAGIQSLLKVLPSIGTP